MYTYHFLKKKKNKVEWNNGNGIAKIGGKKKLLQLVCGNDIAEIEGGGGKKSGNWFEKKKKIGLWQWHCHNYHKSLLFLQWHGHKPIATKKKNFPPISAMPLP